MLNAENNKQDIDDVITNVNVFIIMLKVDRETQIPQGTYDI